jgi:pimeloyl-ACP methyl ester carboxylesterase
MCKRAIIGVCLATLFSVGLPGCADPGLPDSNPTTIAGLSPTAKNGGTQVYLLRGANDIYSLGLDVLAKEMADHGIQALSMGGLEWRMLAQAIEQAYADGSWRGDLVFVGHSYGSDDAVLLAAELDTQNIPVRLLLLIDATNPPRIPKNVDRCVHFYQPMIFADLLPDLLPGNPVQAAPGNDHTQIVNRVVSVQTLGPQVADLDHFTIDSNELIHQLFIEEVLNLTPSQP